MDVPKERPAKGFLLNLFSPLLILTLLNLSNELPKILTANKKTPSPAINSKTVYNKVISPY